MSQVEPKSPVDRPSDTRDAERVKGTLLLARLKFLKSKGDEVRALVLGRLEPADRAVVSGVVLPSSWYPADVLHHLESAIVAMLAGGDRNRLFLELGRFSADTNLAPGGVQRPYLREGDPTFLLRNVPRMYSAQHSTGHRSCEVNGPKAAVIRSESSGPVHPDDCLTTVGWLERAIMLSGGQKARVVETQCISRGATACEYRCDWE
jgi:uncharacterized protein (TIGR02265 family)